MTEFTIQDIERLENKIFIHDLFKNFLNHNLNLITNNKSHDRTKAHFINEHNFNKNINIFIDYIIFEENVKDLSNKYNCCTQYIYTNIRKTLRLFHRYMYTHNKEIFGEER